MFICIFFLLVISALGVPFLPPDTVHTATSELEVNLIINENRNFFILIGTVEDASEKKLQKLQDYFNGTVLEESGISLAIAIDCTKYQYNLNGSLGICKNPNSLIVLAPSGKIVNLFDHHVLSGHQYVPVIGETSQGVLVKKIRDQIPDLIKQIEDDYDLHEFLDHKTTKVIYFDENLLKPPYLKKLALVFYNRIDFAVCDNKQILQRYNMGFGKMLILHYDHFSEAYAEQQYQGDTNFQNNPFSPIEKHLNQYVFPTRQRDILLDFQINQQKPLNITSRQMLSKLMHMDKIVIVQKSRQLECKQLQELMQKYQFLFTYACYNDTDQTMEERKLYHSEIRSHVIHQLKGKPEDTIKFPEIPNLVSSELQMDRCLQNGQMMNKLIAISYISDPYVNYLLRFANAHPGFSSIYYFCKVIVPDKFTFRKVRVVPESLSVLVKQQNHPAGDAFDKVQHTNITSYYSLKMFLREVSIRKILPVVESLSNNLTEVHTPEQLTQHCFSKPCILGLIRPKKSRSKAEISLLTDLAQQFKALNFIWINSQCHYEISKQLKLSNENSQLLYFNEKQNKYNLFQRRYWIKSELRKWLKGFFSADVKFKKLKLSLTIQPKKCEKNIYLDQL